MKRRVPRKSSKLAKPASAGGGGAGLYGPGLDKTADYLHKTYGCFNYADFTAKLVADKHSFVVLDIGPERLELRAIGANGNELDHITITKEAQQGTSR